MPLIAMLFDSVAPDVKTISLLSAPTRLATCSRAASDALSASQPYSWVFECGFPNWPDRKGSIASSTRGSIGVVACDGHGGFEGHAPSLTGGGDDLRVEVDGLAIPALPGDAHHRRGGQPSRAAQPAGGHPAGEARGSHVCVYRAAIRQKEFEDF